MANIFEPKRLFVQFDPGTYFWTTPALHNEVMKEILQNSNCQEVVKDLDNKAFWNAANALYHCPVLLEQKYPL